MDRNNPNAQYNVAPRGGIADRLANLQRRRLYELFMKSGGVEDHDTILDVGATSDTTYDHSNYAIRWSTRPERITALGIDDAAFLETEFPGLTFVRGSGLELPFDDRSFDHVHASAVIEHVGSNENQSKFVSELARVARKSVFITTPNRWFPVEFHTSLPLVHWLPKKTFRHLLETIGLGFFAQEKNLNLMTAADLRRVTSSVGLEQLKVSSVSLGGWPANLVLHGSPGPARERERSLG